MSTETPKRLKPGPKAKSVALKPRSLNSLNTDGRIIKHRKSYTREFKLKALSMLKGYSWQGMVSDCTTGITFYVSQQLGVAERLLRKWKVNEEEIVAS